MDGERPATAAVTPEEGSLLSYAGSCLSGRDWSCRR